MEMLFVELCDISATIPAIFQHHQNGYRPVKALHSGQASNSGAGTDSGRLPALVLQEIF
jgi:hypothetical protein